MELIPRFPSATELKMSLRCDRINRRHIPELNLYSPLNPLPHILLWHAVNLIYDSDVATIALVAMVWGERR